MESIFATPLEETPYETVVENYKKDYDELQRLIAAKDPSINHWRLSTRVKKAEEFILAKIRNE